MSRDEMLRRLLRLAYFVSFLIFPLSVMSLASQRLANVTLRLCIFILLATGGSWLFRRTWPEHGWEAALFITSLGYGTIYKLASFIPDISTYPFSLSWSEASRYYYASLWLSKAVYGIFTPPSILHPSRYLLQALPFLITHSPLVVHRVWQVILWIATASLTSWLLTRRLFPAGQRRSLVTILGVLLWAFLFLFQGPVYYHLLLMVILVLWGYDNARPWRSLFLIIITSLWAGISRVNWLPVPGLLAASLYLLEVPASGKPLWRYLLPPVVWTLVGTALAYASQQAYQAWSGNPAAWFGSSFTSDLLWYRLLPNQTFPLGILPSAMLVSLPLAGLMVLHLYPRWRAYHPIRLVGLAGILCVLFGGGVVVSVKIGGGSNLHNLDAFLSLLLVIGSYIFFGRIHPDSPADVKHAGEEAGHLPRNKFQRALEAILITAAVVLPLYFTVSAGGRLPDWDFPAAQAALQSINNAAQDAVSKGGEVLFINQRHLLTFGYIQGVPLVAEDELVFLMEMAMSNNTAYLEAFHSDLSHQRFALIVAEPLVIQYQGRYHGFGEENDAWVERVSEPVLCYYEPATRLESVGVVLYAPRADPCK